MDAEYELTELSTSTSTDRPSVRYILEPVAFFSGDAVEREEERTGEESVVVDISAVESADVRTAIETAVRRGTWQSNTLPEGLAETVEHVDFFTGVSNDETHTHVGLKLYRLHPDQPPAVEFGARIGDRYVARDSPGAIIFTLTNHGSEPREVFSGTVPPFGMMHAEAATGSGRFLLWHDYEEEGCFSRTEDGWLRCDIGKITVLQPCESVSRRYEVLPSTTTRYPEETVPPEPKRYRVGDSLTYSRGHRFPESTLSFEAEFTLEAP